MALLTAAPVPGDPIYSGMGLEMGQGFPYNVTKEAINAASRLGIGHPARAGTVTVCNCDSGCVAIRKQSVTVDMFAW